ncbi:MAG: TonB family protein [Acidobacteria bacterium]|nr:TonB family protein [Acidobacteriota bacterium]
MLRPALIALLAISIAPYLAATPSTVLQQAGAGRRDAAADLKPVPPMDLPGDDVVVDLVPSQGHDGPSWSPKGATVALHRSGEGDALEGEFRLGPDGDAHNPPVLVALSRSDPDAWSYDQLAIDLGRDGRLSPGERLDTRPELRRGKVWSSCSATLSVQVDGPDGTPRSLPYPIDLWFVIDPASPNEPTVLHWTRRGWMQGSARTDEGPFEIALAEMAMDGVYDRRDCWFLAAASGGLVTTQYRDCDDHAWLGDGAWRIVSMHPSGLQVTLRRFDPGFTRIEEEQLRDRFAADRAAPRADAPLAFGRDLVEAEALARRSGRPLFIDFETTWCGPCKGMDARVYPARAVVEAARASRVVAVKVDGDEHRDLVQRFGVKAYPTMLLIGPDGAEIRRAVGYRSVEQMSAFLSVGEQRPSGEASRGEQADPVDPGATREEPAAAAAELRKEIQAARRRGDFAKAKTMVEQLVASDPNDDAALNELGRLHMAEGDHDLAMACFRKAEAIDGPSKVHAVVGQGLVRIQEKRHEEGRDLLRRALRILDDLSLRELLESIEKITDPDVVPFDEVDVKPQPVRRPSPVLTADLRQRPPAFVRVAFVVEPDGRVRDAYVQQSTDEAFDEVVLATVKSWRFEPGRKGGEVVAVRMQLPMRLPARNEH